MHHVCIVQSVELAGAASEVALEDIECVDVRGLTGMWKLEKDEIESVGCVVSCLGGLCALSLNYYFSGRQCRRYPHPQTLSQP